MKSQKTGKLGMFYINRYLPNFHGTYGFLYIYLHKVKKMPLQTMLMNMVQVRFIKIECRLPDTARYQHFCSNTASRSARSKTSSLPPRVAL